MKEKIILFTVLLFGFLIFLGMRILIINNSENYGVLKVEATPIASIFLNSLNIGKTPFNDKVKEGEYIIKLIPEATESASWQGKIQIYKNIKTYVNLELGSSDINTSGEIITMRPIREKYPKNKGQIEVITEPQGAIVYLDNEEKGISPLILDEVPLGIYEVSVFRPGFFKRIQKINTENRYRVILNFKLAIDQTSDFYKKTEGEKNNQATESTKIKKEYAIIKENELGFLRVREKPTIYSSEAARVKPGDKFEILEEDQGWYKISYEQGKEGWVSSLYVEKKEE